MQTALAIAVLLRATFATADLDFKGLAIETQREKGIPIPINFILKRHTNDYVLAQAYITVNVCQPRPYSQRNLLVGEVTDEENSAGVQIRCRDPCFLKEF